jgi:hypothetical protein
MANFRKVEISISKASGYGQYYITANYKGKEIKVHTTDSECYDWLEDDSNKTKNLEAKRFAYNKIVNAFKNL